MVYQNNTPRVLYTVPKAQPGSNLQENLGDPNTWDPTTPKVQVLSFYPSAVKF